MDIEKMIRELEYTARKHSKDKVNTFGTDITAMCNEVSNKLKVVLEVRDNIEETIQRIKNYTHPMEYNTYIILNQVLNIVEEEFNKL
jgi:hypothetical protein